MTSAPEPDLVREIDFLLSDPLKDFCSDAECYKLLQLARDRIAFLAAPCSWPKCAAALCDKPCYDFWPPSPKVRERIAQLERELAELRARGGDQ